MTDYFMISFMIWSMILWFSWFMSGAHQIWWAPVYVIYDKVNSTRKKCQQKGKLTPFTWTTECTMFTPPPQKKKKKLAVTIVSNFSWVLQSSQEKSKTMVMHKVHYGLCENGEFTHLWLKISVFFVFPKWHKIQLLLQRLEVTFKNASNVTWLTWTWPL